ncbi:MAG: hypothetical protein VYB17_02620 [Candidatus Thermoplasmatota archaeon]|nr:hypothetical protein [Candidatus Thermoplasmatota archaeon]
MRKSVTTLICLLLVSILLSGCVERLTGMDQERDSGIQNVYRATDSASTPTEGTNDTLFAISWNEAYDDLYWGYVVMKLEIGDSVYDCTITGGDCFISQDGDDETLWQTNEFLTIMENDVNLVGESGVIVNLYISYRGNQISGSDSVYVQ